MQNLADSRKSKAKHSTKRPSPGIQSQLVLLLLLVLIPIWLVQAAIYYDRLQGRHGLAVQLNLDFARAMVKTFDGFIQDVLDQEITVGTALTASQPLPEQDVDRLLEKSREGHPSVRCFSFADPTGRCLASGDYRFLGENIADEPYFQEIRSGKDWTVSDLFHPLATGDPVFVISRGVRNSDGILLGVVVAEVVPELLDMVLSIERKDDGTLDIIDRRGVAVYRQPSVKWNWDERSRSKDQPFVKEALAGREVSEAVVSDIDGKKRMVAAVPIASIGWVVGAGVVESEAINPVPPDLLPHVVAFCVVALSAMAFAFFVARKISLPVKRLQEHALLLGNGETNSEIEIGGASELQELARALNTMAEKVRAREEDLIEIRNELERRVEDRTLDLTRSNEALKSEIIDRNRAEETARAERGRLFSLLDSLPAFVYLRASDNSIRFSNKFFQDRFGNHQGKPCHEILRMRADPCEVCPSSDVFQTGHPTSWEWTDSNRGKVYQIYCYPFTDIDGSTLVMELGIDMTDRKRAEDALRESEERYRAIVQDQTELISRFRPDGTLTFVNGAYCRFFGESQWELIGRKFWYHVPEGDAKKLRNHISSLSPANPVKTIEHRVITGTGEVRWQQWTDRLVLDEEGKGLEIQAVGRDITERKQAEEAIEQSERELRTLSSRLLSAQEDERKRIAGEIHDSLGSSLAAIKVNLQNTRVLLEKDTALAHSLDDPISWLQNAMDEARRIMADLRPSILDDMGLIPTLDWFFRQYRSAYPGVHIERDVRIEEVDVPEPLKIIIFRIVQESFHNVAKYSKAEFVDFSLVKGKDSIELVIEDNGDGFDPDPVLAGKNPGKGMGLTSMRERAELAGGVFSITSVLGEGTTIRASWPIGRLS